MFAAVVERFPRLDILVNNAGVQTWKPLLDLEEAGVGPHHRHQPEGLLPVHAARGPAHARAAAAGAS